ncbi:LLM class flavin-dependent oxidoreductase [Nonomuraea cavernae]|uniref:N5,N10-methylene tetrahydromethanopterin reductase n=1 Tax=Nonomuraea cavernae TaxID=2045107 RepID=A0A917YZU5_9ACTN|nr:LLM class flavin-dependent oxidoreductase [Nonomuraea cavernae]MCA2185984.1 LLM class flavin-dependent oxidoreductase [Nonomuraea cavernae]GGO69037.1 N5,N10-methylene tetrahydromethanopterin reductase [Nonomuraea cavernae]
MKIGYVLPTRERAVLGEHDPAPLVRQAQRAERLGLDSVWAGDSPLARPRADPLMLLAAVSAATERIALGTAVLLPALRHPILLAHQLATLDRLSGERLIAGMGGGFPRADTAAQCAAIGVDHARRISRMEESITVMRRLWSGESVSHEGRHFGFDDVRLVPAPLRPSGPEIWLAGSGRPALSRVSRLADGWLPYSPSPTTYATERDIVEQSAARPITPAFYATLTLDEDAERARQSLRTSIERYYDTPLELVEQVQAVFAGTARDAAGWLAGYVAAGARHLVIRLAADDQETGLEELADRVLPLLRTEEYQ